MKVLVTGAKGQLGKEVVKQLEEKNDLKLYKTDKLDLDITKLNDVVNKISSVGPDVVINCAAFTAVDACEEQIETAYQINAIGPRNLAIACNKFDIKLIHISTDYVFDGEGEKNRFSEIRPYNEFDTPNPKTIYGKSKKAGEDYIMSLCRKYFILRTAWLYGDGNNFIKKIINQVESNNKIKVVHDQFGSPTSVTELVKVIIGLMDTEAFGIYHATCEGGCSWYEFSLEILKILNIEYMVEPCFSDEFASIAKRPKYAVIDNKVLEMTSEIKMKHWIDALKEYLSEVVE